MRVAVRKISADGCLRAAKNCRPIYKVKIRLTFALKFAEIFREKGCLGYRGNISGKTGEIIALNSRESCVSRSRCFTSIFIAIFVSLILIFLAISLAKYRIDFCISAGANCISRESLASIMVT